MAQCCLAVFTSTCVKCLSVGRPQEAAVGIRTEIDPNVVIVIVCWNVTVSCMPGENNGELIEIRQGGWGGL